MEHFCFFVGGWEGGQGDGVEQYFFLELKAPEVSGEDQKSILFSNLVFL